MCSNEISPHIILPGSKILRYVEVIHYGTLYLESPLFTNVVSLYLGNFKNFILWCTDVISCLVNFIHFCAGFYKLVPYYDWGVVWNKLNNMHTTSIVMSHCFAELQGQNVISSNPRICIRSEQWLEIEMYVLGRQKVWFVTPDWRHGVVDAVCVYIYMYIYMCVCVYVGWTRVGTVGSGTVLQVGRLQLQFLMVSLEVFIDINLLSTLRSWGSLSP